MVFNIQRTEKNEVKARYSSKAIVNLWSSLSEDTHEQFHKIVDAYGCSDVVLYQKPDEPFGRNVFKAHSHGRVAKEQLRRTLEAELDGTAEVFTVKSPDGAGMSAIAGAKPFQRIPLDALTVLLVVSPSPREHEKVCQAMNLATMNPDKHSYVFLSKVDHDRNDIYPRRLARMLGTMRWIDSTNVFSRGAAYRWIDPGAVASTREAIREKLSTLKAELGTQPDELFGFDPAHWLVDDLSATDIWSEDQYEAYVRAPPRFENTNLTDKLGGNEIDMNTATVPVPHVEILVTRELSTEFVKRVKIDRLRWLWQNAHDVDHWCKLVRRERGRNVDPRRAVEEFVTEQLQVRDPAVLAVFEEGDFDG